VGFRKTSSTVARSKAVARRRARPCVSRSFILLEILVALVILGVALAAVLRSFTNGLKSISYDRKISQAVLLAQALLEDFEIEPPEEDRAEGTFEPDWPDYSYQAEFERVAIKYRDITASTFKRNLEPMRKVTLRIYYRGPNSIRTVSLLELETYLTDIEKYAPATKNMHGLF